MFIYPYRPATSDNTIFPTMPWRAPITTYTTPSPAPELDFDTSRDGDTLTVWVKLPGYTKENISVSLDANCLNVRASSESAFIGKFIVGDIEIPECDYKEAKLENGILTVVLMVRSNKIEIPIS